MGWASREAPPISVHFQPPSDPENSSPPGADPYYSPPPFAVRRAEKTKREAETEPTRRDAAAGGSEYTTTVDTLTQREPGSLLAAMFAGGAHRLPTTEEGAGAVFVDRDGEQFRHVLNWLRDGDVAALAEDEYQQLLREAEYYRMHGLIDSINERIREKVDSSSEAELTRKDVIKCIQTDKVRFRGVNLSGLDLSKLDLSEVDFSCGCIKTTDFSRANLHKAKFGEVEASSFFIPLCKFA